MIRFRLDQAAGETAPPVLFSRSGLLAIYLATGGYPRKIITLCHHVILAMIIQNRSRAGWFLVQSCAARLAAAERSWPSRLLRWAPVALLASAVLLIFLVAQPLTTSSVKAPPETASSEAPQGVSPVAGASTLPGSSAEVSPATPDTVRETPSKPKAMQEPSPAPGTAQKTPTVREVVAYEKPQLLGKLTLQNGRTVWWMLTDLYGEYNRDILRSVAKANPHIRNLHRVQAGQIVHLPALPAGKGPLERGAYWIQVMTSPDLGEAYEFYRTHKTKFPSLRFLPYWNPRQGMLFTTLLKDGFSDEAAARQNLSALPADLAANADVMKTPEPDTVYYSR